MTGRIGHPVKGEPGYQEYLEKKNARRRAKAAQRKEKKKDS